MAVEGGCRCGAVRYSIAIGDLPPVYCCHCRDCQSWSGSAFTQQAAVREEALSAAGPVAIYRFTNPSGSTSTQYVCGTCHTRVWNTNTARPGLAVIRVGTLDRSDELVPRAHIWTKRKQPWVVIADDVAQFLESAPPAEFAAILIR